MTDGGATKQEIGRRVHQAHLTPGDLRYPTTADHTRASPTLGTKYDLRNPPYVSPGKRLQVQLPTKKTIHRSYQQLVHRSWIHRISNFQITIPTTHQGTLLFRAVTFNNLPDKMSKQQVQEVQSTESSLETHQVEINIKSESHHRESGRKPPGKRVTNY